MLFPELSLRAPRLSAGPELGVFEKYRGGGTALSRVLGHRTARLTAGSFRVFL